LSFVIYLIIKRDIILIKLITPLITLLLLVAVNVVKIGFLLLMVAFLQLIKQPILTKFSQD